jgi:hypothetical protein
MKNMNVILQKDKTDRNSNLSIELVDKKLIVSFYFLKKIAVHEANVSNKGKLLNCVAESRPHHFVGAGTGAIKRCLSPVPTHVLVIEGY